MRIKKNNLSESVYQRLKKVAIARKRPMQEILRYYAIERFLYRLSISQYKKSFFLKGGLLLMIWNPQTYRATLDIDLLARVKNSADTLLQIIKEICALEGDSDGVEFDVRNVRLIETQLNAEYKGFSARFFARLSTARLLIQIDIGFSDKIFPQPIEVKYPSLLEFPPPKLKGYTPETSIAEKLHAIMKLGLANTRMKDFYDIWVIINQFQIDPMGFKSVLKGVFRNRKTLIQGMPKAFSEKFYANPRTIERWNAFIKGINQKPIALDKVISELKQFFRPMLSEEKALQQQDKAEQKDV